MQHRCLDCPDQSAVPVAIARADGWKWVICERGYANIVPPPLSPLPTKEEDVGEEQNSESSPPPPSSSSDVVWGVLYNMTAGDVEVLDRYEGHDKGRNPTPTPVAMVARNREPEKRGRKLFEQGNWVRMWVFVLSCPVWLLSPVSSMGGSLSRGFWVLCIYMHALFGELAEVGTC